MIITANHYFGLTPPLHMKTWGEWFAQIVSLTMRRRGLQEPTSIASQGVVMAEVRQGAWMFICPGCKGAELIWEEGLAMCLSCFNEAAGHQLLLSAFPSERRAIEAILEPRPLTNRNWWHNETLAELERENSEHGLEVR